MSAEVDKLRSQLYLDLGAFVDTYRAATDKDAPRWRDEALTRVSQVYRYATLEGRRRFLDEMKLPGADKERRLAFEVCQRGGSDEATCRAKAEALPLFRPIFEAFQLTYVSKGLLLEQEKNVSALSPTGPSAGASATAEPARKPARTARRG